MSGFSPTDSRLLLRNNTDELCGLSCVIPHAQRASAPSPVTSGAQRLAAEILRRAVVPLRCSLGSSFSGVESVQWEHAIKRIVELLLTTEDLKTVQSLTSNFSGHFISI